MDNEIKISLRFPPDGAGLTGRECPSPKCQRYFKIQFGTGLPEEGLPCHCPYCGHVAGHDHFLTQDQIRHARSVVGRHVLSEAVKEMKDLERLRYPIGPFGLELSFKVEGRPDPIYTYKEEELETEVVCEKCTLRYAIYGVFAWCPDCGKHNSLQILNKNLELARKKIVLAETQDEEIADHIVADALQNTVAAVDGFGRECCRVNAENIPDPGRARSLSFQNLPRARKNVKNLFGFDFARGVEASEWKHLCKLFEKRHLLAHRMGIVDEKYISATNDAEAVLGRKIQIGPDEVIAQINSLKKIGRFLVEELSKVES